MLSLHKTEIPCDCGVVSMLLNDPDTGIVIDKIYGIVIETKNGATYPLYHCSFCGGRLPDSSKPIWYPQLTTEEENRLLQLFEGITSMEAAVARFGPPDYDLYTTYYEHAAKTTAKIVREQDIAEGALLDSDQLALPNYRCVAYYNLSEHADVDLVFHANFSGRPVISLKNIPPRHVTDE